MPHKSLPYQRVDYEKLDERSAEAKRSVHEAGGDALTVRWIVVPIAILVCVLQSILSIYNTNVLQTITTSTLIPVIGFTGLFGTILCINPMLRLSWRTALTITLGMIVFAAVYTWFAFMGYFSEHMAQVANVFDAFCGIALFALGLRYFSVRPFNRPELVCVFAAMMVTSGISTFGLTEQLIPLVATPFNPDWNTPQRGWNDKLIPNLNPSLYIQDPEVIKTFRIGVTQDSEKKPIIKPTEGAGIQKTSYYYWKVFCNIPWLAWIVPLFWWMIFVLGVYAMFYSLSYVLLGYWSDREKLIFPLAKLPESLMPDPDKPNDWIPPIFRTGGFWLGFAISFGIIAWNCMIAANLLSGGIRPIKLGMGGWDVAQLLQGTPLEGGVFSGMQFLVIFTAIGIAFFLPLEISFSIWFYYLLGIFGMVIAVAAGYGQNQRDFPTNWLWNNNFLSGQGGGGLLLFSLICLVRCLRDYIKLIPGKPWMEKASILAPVLGLASSLVVVALWLNWSNHQMGLFWAFVFVFVCTLVTIGLMRIVAEGGVYWFQSHASFFHIFKMTGLGNMLSPVALGPLLPIYSVLFLDVKTFLAPSLLNAAKMEHSTGAGHAGTARTRFHLCIVGSVLCSVVVSLGFAVFLAHIRGAQTMHSWFYSGGPVMMMDLAAAATIEQPSVDYAMIGWYIVGAVWVGLSFYLRTSMFWFPHPIGYIMLVNPLMTQLWFSFFIAWILKKLTVKYGGKVTFERLRVIFIGLILGELIAISFWGMLGMLTSIHAAYDLNRY